MKRANRKQLDEKASGKAEAKGDNTLTGAVAKVMLAPQLWKNTWLACITPPRNRN